MFTIYSIVLTCVSVVSTVTSNPVLLWDGNLRTVTQTTVKRNWWFFSWIWTKHRNSIRKRTLRRSRRYRYLFLSLTPETGTLTHLFKGKFEGFLRWCHHNMTTKREDLLVTYDHQQDVVLVTISDPRTTESLRRSTNRSNTRMWGGTMNVNSSVSTWHRFVEWYVHPSSVKYDENANCQLGGLWSMIGGLW